MSTYTRVSELLRRILGEPYGDGQIVTAVISGYAEPGYGSADSVVVLGNWNAKRFPREGEPPITAAENLPPRLFDALERAGAECEWLDEWTECQGCFRAVRTQSDSYMWRPSYAWLPDAGELLCRDCLVDMGPDAVESYLNNSDACVTWCESSHLESLGFEQWEPRDPHVYESGWHPGQTDKPGDILAEIQLQLPDSETVFYLDESSQFYVRFTAYVRMPADNDEVTP